VEAFINKCLTTMPVFQYMDARVALQDLYETEFGIYNHLQRNKNPLSSVLLHDSEDYVMHSDLRDMLEEFGMYNLGELWNLSLTEYLALPIPVVHILRGIKDEVIEKKSKLMDRAVRGLK